MPKLTLRISDDLAQRLTILADAYDCDVTELALELVSDGVMVCEAAIEREACEQIRYLAQVDPAGTA